MSDGPLVSVVVPTYQRAGLLRRAIDSVLQERTVPLELIVVDDGSTDATGAVLDAVGDPRLRTHRQANAGRGAARNQGAALARGSFLLFLDSDDEARPGLVARLLALGPEASLSSCAYELLTYGADGSVAGRAIRLPKPLSREDPGLVGSYAAGSFLVRKEAFEAVGGYDAALCHGENWELFLRLVPHLASRRERVVSTDEALLRVHRDRRWPPTRSGQAGVLRSIERILDRHGRGAARSLSPASHAEHLAVAAVAAARLGQHGAARRHLLHAVRAAPGNPRHWLRLGLSLVPPLAGRVWRRLPADPAPVSSVLFVIDGLWVGGSERSLAEMLPGLRGMGVSCSVAVLRHCQEGVEEEVRRGGTRIDLLAGPGLLAQVRALRRLIRAERPPIVHSSLWRSNLVARLAVAGTGARHVTSLVNAPYGPERLAGDRAIRRGPLRLAQAAEALGGRWLTHHFHAVSEYARASAVRDLWVPAHRVSVVRRGRDVSRLGQPSPERRARTRALLGIEPGARVLVNVGRQDYQKAQALLIDALAAVVRPGDGVVLLLVGRAGQASPTIERRIAEAGLGPRVRCLGHRDDVPDVLAAADLFVFPSLWEGLPGAVLEAMALGLPVLASAIAPNREILEGESCGVLVPPGDREALAAALASLLADPVRLAAMGARSRALFEGRHTLEKSLEGMLALYSRVLAG